jgi:hypothetical protein
VRSLGKGALSTDPPPSYAEGNEEEIEEEEEEEEERTESDGGEEEDETYEQSPEPPRRHGKGPAKEKIRYKPHPKKKPPSLLCPPKSCRYSYSSKTQAGSSSPHLPKDTS